MINSDAYKKMLQYKQKQNYEKNNMHFMKKIVYNVGV